MAEQLRHGVLCLREAAHAAEHQGPRDGTTRRRGRRAYGREQDTRDPCRLAGAQTASRVPRQTAEPQGGDAQVPPARRMAARPFRGARAAPRPRGGRRDPRIRSRGRMILDSSALVAIFTQESGHEGLIDAVAEAPAAGVGAPTLVEAGIVLSVRMRLDARPLLT